MNKLTRRSFLTRAALASATVSWSARSWAQVRSANDDVRVGVIGFGGRGQSHIEGFSRIKGCRLTGLCDVDSTILGKEKQKWADKGVELSAVSDLRKLLEDKNIDAVSIATPNHWHSLAAIWAIQAGKDVYVEKPVSHNVWEGRQLVKAARKHDKIVQAGTQSRSSSGIREAFAWLHEGHLGKIKLARGLCYKSRPSIGKTEGPQKVPDNVDYDLWCGPAPLLPPRRKSANPKWGTIHYDWHWFWNYGNGDLGNQGIHQMDIARWALGVSELSPRVISLGGRLGYIDDGETPNTQIVYHDYPVAPLLFEVRGLPEKTGSKSMDHYKSRQFGAYRTRDKKADNAGEPRELKPGVSVIIECEGGELLVPSYTSATAFDNEGKELKSWSGSEDHFANFYKAVRSRKISDLNADILEGHLSSALCHTGNISYRLGKQQAQDDIRSALKKNSALTEAFGRMAGHLEANGVDLDRTKATLGIALTMDPKSERFVGNDAANKMLTREYRLPYVVPAEV